DSIAEVIDRLEVLRELTAPVHAYQVITRLPHYASSGRGREEPEYWTTHGRLLFELSQTWDRYERGEASAEEVAAAARAVPGGRRGRTCRARRAPRGSGASAAAQPRRHPRRARPGRRRCAEGPGDHL